MARARRRSAADRAAAAAQGQAAASPRRPGPKNRAPAVGRREAAAAQAQAKKGRQNAPKPKQKIPARGPVTRQITKPGTPGVRRPATNPFLNAEDILADADKRARWQGELADAQEGYTRAAGELPAKLRDIEHDTVQRRESSDSSAVARGIFRSSIRDMAMGDINANEVLQTQAARGLVDAAQRTLAMANQRIFGAGGEAQRQDTYASNKAVQNARDADQGKSPWDQEPGQPTKVTVIDYDPQKPGIQGKPATPTPRAQQRQREGMAGLAGRGVQGMASMAGPAARAAMAAHGGRVIPTNQGGSRTGARRAQPGRPGRPKVVGRKVSGRVVGRGGLG